MATLTIAELITKKEYQLTGVDLSWPVAYLKLLMWDKTGMPAEQLNVVFPADRANKPLANDQILSAVGIANGSRVGSSLMMRGSTPAEKEEWAKWQSQFKNGKPVA